jgi:hypothetical protein
VCISSQCTLLYFTTAASLHITLARAALHCIALHCIALHYTRNEYFTAVRSTICRLLTTKADTHTHNITRNMQQHTALTSCWTGLRCDNSIMEVEKREGSTWHSGGSSSGHLYHLVLGVAHAVDVHLFWRYHRCKGISLRRG